MEIVSEQQSITFMEILLRMGYTDRQIFDLCHLTEIPEAMLQVLTVLQERDYNIPFKELLPIAKKIEAAVEAELPDDL